jgi:Asp-tRNA(Asn)/Glu-tRNA(Gln) amidotransferase C subunit
MVKKMGKHKKDDNRLEEEEWYRRLISDVKPMVEKLNELTLKEIEQQKKKHPIEVKKNLDRMQALIRIPEYQKDYEELDKLVVPEMYGLFEENKEKRKEAKELYLKKEEEIKKKYNINWPIPVDSDGRIDFGSLLDREFFQYLSVISGDMESSFLEKNMFFKKCLSQLMHKGVLRNIFYDVDQPVILKEVNEIRQIEKNGKQIQRSGKYLMVEIDLEAKKEEIMTYFEEIIDHFKKVIKKKETRNKGPKTLNIWEIYDMHHKEKLSFSKIAQRLSGINKPPAYNERVMNMYKAVRRAYNKAKELIDQERIRLKVN